MLIISKQLKWNECIAYKNTRSFTKIEVLTSSRNVFLSLCKIFESCIHFLCHLKGGYSSKSSFWCFFKQNSISLHSYPLSLWIEKNVKLFSRLCVWNENIGYDFVCSVPVSTDQNFIFHNLQSNNYYSIDCKSKQSIQFLDSNVSICWSGIKRKKHGSDWEENQKLALCICTQEVLLPSLVYGEMFSDESNQSLHPTQSSQFDLTFPGPIGSFQFLYVFEISYCKYILNSKKIKKRRIFYKIISIKLFYTTRETGMSFSANKQMRYFEHSDRQTKDWIFSPLFENDCEFSYQD